MSTIEVEHRLRDHFSAWQNRVSFLVKEHSSETWSESAELSSTFDGLLPLSMKFGTERTTFGHRFHIRLGQIDLTQDTLTGDILSQIVREGMPFARP